MLLLYTSVTCIMHLRCTALSCPFQWMKSRSFRDFSLPPLNYLNVQFLPEVYQSAKNTQLQYTQLLYRNIFSRY